MYFNGWKKFVNNKFYLLIQVINYHPPKNKFNAACTVLIRCSLVLQRYLLTRINLGDSGLFRFFCNTSSKWRFHVLFTFND
ncbi:hypothetical protein VCRA2110O318_410001 [Vibrio crassostreae]|nr:hypothetical protein VCRA2117O328_330014 [Vibrio crassostreae]CAK2333768.1 hypothetical protein VCRA2110O318_410001 [Vibrio crassostreae]